MSAALFALAILARVDSASAQSAPMRTAIRVADGEDRELLSRVQGQTVDVAVTLVEVRGHALETSVHAQLRAARTIAREQRARVVVWFRHLVGGAVVVYVADPAANTVLVRQVSAPSGESPAVERSAAAEAAALVVRSALRALSAGGRIGVETSAIAAREEAEASPDTPRVMVVGRDSSSWFTSVGGQVALDGASTHGTFGLAARIGHKRGSVRAALLLGASLPTSIDDELTSVEMARHAAALALGVDVWRPGRAVLTVEAFVGAVGFFRSTVALQPEVVPTPNRVTTALLLGPGVRVLLQPLESSRRVWVELGLAADVVVGRPELGYQAAGGFVRRDALWPVQPRAELAIGIHAF